MNRIYTWWEKLGSFIVRVANCDIFCLWVWDCGGYSGKNSFWELIVVVSQEIYSTCERHSTWTLSPKFVWSSLFAPILIWGGSPVKFCKLSKVLKKKSFRAVVPTQSVQRSCSMERDTKDWDTREAVEGGVNDIGTSRHEASWLRSKNGRASRNPAINIIFRNGGFIYFRQMDLLPITAFFTGR